LYADQETESLKKAVGETRRRRAAQEAYNKKHGITPTTIKKAIKDITEELRSEHTKAIVTSMLEVDKEIYKKNPRKFIYRKKKTRWPRQSKTSTLKPPRSFRDEIYALWKTTYTSKGPRPTI
jgi:excinuclease ABC subunit B